MKRLLTIALLLMMVLTAGAQGTWTVSHREADPMKNQDARDVYIYDVGGKGSVVVWDWGKADFRLISDNGGFHIRISNGMQVVPVKVGFYDDSGTLEKMYEIMLVPEDNTNYKWLTTAGFYYFGRGNIRKIMKRMKSGKGYVRFLAELYGNKYFDINVKPFKQE